MFIHLEGNDGDEEEQQPQEEDDDDIDVEKDSFFASVHEQYVASSENEDPETTLFGNYAGSDTIGAPLTLWTIPDIASVGFTKEQAIDKAKTAAQKSSIVTGRANFCDMARGRLSGDASGFLKVRHISRCITVKD